MFIADNCQGGFRGDVREGRHYLAVIVNRGVGHFRERVCDLHLRGLVERLEDTFAKPLCYPQYIDPVYSRNVHHSW